MTLKRLLGWFRRRDITPLESFPDAWGAFLWEQSAHYRRLPNRFAIAFERDVWHFVSTRRITGVDTDVDDPLRLLVAASASTLTAGWPGYDWSEASEILLYGDDFDRDYVVGRPELAGMAHVWGTVILSIPSLLHSFASYENPYHVGFHEFAHLLTYAKGEHMNVPVGLAAAKIRQWEAVQSAELQRVADGNSIISSYALQPSEFFPCSVEAFFQKPIELKKRHRTLYAFLSRYFRQSPALWESRQRLGSRGHSRVR